MSEKLFNKATELFGKNTADGKVNAIATATTNTYVAATKALAATPPPFGYIQDRTSSTTSGTEGRLYVIDDNTSVINQMALFTKKGQAMFGYASGSYPTEDVTTRVITPSLRVTAPGSYTTGDSVLAAHNGVLVTAAPNRLPYMANATGSTGPNATVYQAGIDTLSGNIFFYAGNSSSNKPAGVTAGYVSQYQQSSTERYQVFYTRDLDSVYHRTMRAGTWGSWYRFLDTKAAVVNSQLATMANNTIKGNVSVSTAAPGDLTATQVAAMIQGSFGGITATQYKLSALNTAPASATDTGATGEVRITATFIYVCIATNTWVRSTLSTW